MSDIDTMIMATQARVTARSADPGLLTLAKARALDPAIFDEYAPFLWQSEISSDRLDAYYTVMDPATTLVNYAADAAAGVAVLIGHDSRALPTGYSLTGTLETQDGAQRVVSDAYALTEPASAAAITRLRAGVVRDISVGFSTRGATCVCSICARDMWRDWTCWHIPGVRYKRTDNPADTVSDPNGVLCTGRIVDAHLSEYSLVYDGATPGAAVLQAQRNAEAGRLTPGLTRMLEQRYRMVLPDRHIQRQGATMAKEPLETDRDSQPETLRAVQALIEGVAPKGSTIEQGVRWLIEERARLAPLAKDGETYRADLIETGVAEAVRAFGAEKGEAKRALLTAAPLDTIKEFTASWREIGDAALPGGRLSENSGEDPPAAPKPVRIGGLSRA